MPTTAELPLTWERVPGLLATIREEVVGWGQAAPSRLFVYHDSRLRVVLEGPPWCAETAGLVANTTCRTIRETRPDAAVVTGTCMFRLPRELGGDRTRRAAMWVVLWADRSVMPYGPTGFVVPLGAPGEPSDSPIPGLPDDRHVLAITSTLDGDDVDEFPVDPAHAQLQFTLLVPPEDQGDSIPWPSRVPADA